MPPAKRERRSCLPEVSQCTKRRGFKSISETHTAPPRRAEATAKTLRCNFEFLARVRRKRFLNWKKYVALDPPNMSKTPLQVPFVLNLAIIPIEPKN